jgi:hypothetical protein
MAKGVQRERKRKISSYNVVTFLFDFYTRGLPGWHRPVRQKIYTRRAGGEMPRVFWVEAYSLVCVYEKNLNRSQVRTHRSFSSNVI